MKNKKWYIKSSALDSEAITDVSIALNVSKTLASIIVNRGYKTVEEAKDYLNKSQEILHDPYLLNDMDKAVERISLAIENKEKITIYGDFDVDGVTSVSILYLYLEKNGALVDYYVPCRKSEGYGVSCDAIDKIQSRGSTLIITVDTGVTANREVEYAKTLGIDMIVTDHHECTEDLPNAIAVINPKRRDTTYPFASLAGVGVAFKLLCALEKNLKSCDTIDAVRNVAYGYSDLTAIGTIADVMPMVDENRILISLGLLQAEKTDKIGLSTLMEYCKNGEGKANSKYKQKRKLSSGFVGYSFAPKINAAGRISSASLAVDLFLTKDKKVANDLSFKLCDINRERQALENKIADEAIKMSEEYENCNSIVLDCNDWHNGVIGIVASKVTEKYGVPAILISFEGNEDPSDMEAIGKGSGRSVTGLNLVDALSYCGDLLEKFGGHDLAAGLSIKRKNVQKFREKFEEYAKKCFDGNDPEIVLNVDCELDNKDLTLNFVRELAYLEPYGVSNPTPLFVMRNAIITDILPVGMNRHLKLTVSKNESEFNAMLFSTTLKEFSLSVGDEVDFVFVLDINEFNGNTNLQIAIKDIRPSERICHFENINQDLFLSAERGESQLGFDYIIPKREDFAKVFTYLQSCAKLGIEAFRYSRLLSDLIKASSTSNFNYVKLKFAIKIFKELNIISIDEIDDFSFSFAFSIHKEKKDLESSFLLKKLKSLYLN